MVVLYFRKKKYIKFCVVVNLIDLFCVCFIICLIRLNCVYFEKNMKLISYFFFIRINFLFVIFDNCVLFILFLSFIYLVLD